MIHMGDDFSRMASWDLPTVKAGKVAIERPRLPEDHPESLVSKSVKAMSDFFDRLPPAPKSPLLFKE